jgi:transketolase
VISGKEEHAMFEREFLTDEETRRFCELSRYAKGDILTMTTLAGSGHPGGSMSSLDIYLVLFSFADLSAWPRDRIVVSHGHTSPGVYASLARLGFMPIQEVVAFFRQAGSPFEGHVVKGIPYIDWTTGNLGQGLSAGCGFALGARLRGEPSHVYVLMGDGEQQKGQLGEARRFAKKYGLSGITAVIDHNGLQISGGINCVMPQNIIENYLSDGWDVIECDGHDHGEIYRALRRARSTDNSVCIVARTVMGKGVPFMEHKEKYHGSPLSQAEYREAMKIIGLEDDLDAYRERRKGLWTWKPEKRDQWIAIDSGTPFTYSDADKTDNRTAFGKALKDLGDRNIGKGTPIGVLDCDLAGSVKTGDFAKAFPGNFFQGGIQEHNTATVAGALSDAGVLTFFADFGVFGIDETYNQARLNDINKTSVKLILTHLGLDVGPDGKTHQCIDYIGLVRGLYNFGIIVPADPNQTDRAIRYVASQQGNCLVGMGRSRWPVILREDGRPLFSNGYEFVYGKMDVIRPGEDGAIITYGGMVHRAIRIREALMEEGIDLCVVNMPCGKEIDHTLMERLRALPYIFTYEDHNIHTGIAPLIAGYLLGHRYSGRLESYGVKGYGVSGESDDAYRFEGLDVTSMTGALLRTIKGD